MYNKRGLHGTGLSGDATLRLTIVASFRWELGNESN